MYLACDHWYDDYDSMLKFPDGEYRLFYEKKGNDFSDETVETKMKYFWLFDSEFPVITSWIA